MQNNKIELIHEKTSYFHNTTEIFNKICGMRPYTLLLESADTNNKNNLKSIILTDSALRITSIKQVVTLQALSNNGLNILSLFDSYILPDQVIYQVFPQKRELIFPDVKKYLDEDTKLMSISIFDCFRFLIKLFNSKNESSKEMFFGGMFSYDLISNFENLKIKFKSKNFYYDFCFYLAEIMIIFDHKKKDCLIKGINFGQSILEQKELKNKIKILKNKIESNIQPIKNKIVNNIKIQYNLNDKEYKNMIKYTQNKIRTGEIFQAVISRKFLVPCPSAISAYHYLKIHHSSPYMFFMQDNEFTLFGASPESALKYDQETRQIEIYPIAGTRARGFKKNGKLDHDLDSRIELEMILDQKELSEHIMLVDLARNDLAKICIPGTRYVSDLLKVDRYSYVMHLVSRVIGQLRKELDVFHAYRACMNMGTLTGAPKVRAMQLIYDIEKEFRGSYGGAMGYFTSSGKLDTCIIIRSAYIKNDIAIVQAGAGIVLDSVPDSEVYESHNKAKSILNSIIYSHSIKEKFYNV